MLHDSKYGIFTSELYSLAFELPQDLLKPLHSSEGFQNFRTNQRHNLITLKRFILSIYVPRHKADGQEIE